MKIYNIINIPKGLSQEIECDCREEYNSGYTEGLEEGFDKGYDSGYTDGAESVDCEDFYNSGYTDGYESGYTSGYTDGQESVDCTDFYNSGVTDGYASGYTSGRTDGYDDGWQPGYDSGRTDGEEAGYDTGYEEGKEYQKAQLVSTAITTNGTYEREDGFNQVVVNVPSMSGAGYDSGYTDGYESGYTDGSEDGFDSGYTSGATDQKNKMEALSISENNLEFRAGGVLDGFFQREDGWNDVSAVIYISPYIQEYGYKPGYASGYTSGKTDGYASGYTSGKTDGYGSGVTAGEEAQKAKMTHLDISENDLTNYQNHLDGEFTREDGWNDIFVSIDINPNINSAWTRGYEAGYPSGVTDGYASGYTSGRTDGYQDGWTPGYNSGYTDGVNTCGGDYASGYTDGFEHGYDSGHTDGYDEGYQSGNTDGFETGYDSGYTDGAASVDCQNFYDSGYTSGHTDGIAEQKAKLVSTAITTNGTYSREDGWNNVIINVPQTGHTDQEMQDSWNSGYTSGKTDGYDEGYNSGYTDGAASVDCEDFYNSGVTDGFGSGYTSGVTDGGNAQKAKLSAATFTQNGTYTRADGWSSVTVYVSGYTQQDLENAYNSGWTNGYDSGYTDGYESGHTPTPPTPPSSAETRLAMVFNADTEMPVYIMNGAGIANDFTKAELENGTSIDIKSQYFDGRYIFPTTGEQLVYYTMTGDTIPTRAFAYNCTKADQAYIPSGVTTIGISAFEGCTNLTGVSLADTVLILSGGTFKRCEKLTGIDLNNVTTIGDECFHRCYSLSSITIPSSVTAIGVEAFEYCSGLTEMHFKGTVPPTLGNEYALGQHEYTFPIYVPCESLEAYQTAFGSGYTPRIMCEEEHYDADVTLIYELKDTQGRRAPLASETFMTTVEKMRIDGVEVEPVSAYTFETYGHHTVEFFISSAYHKIIPSAFAQLNNPSPYRVVISPRPDVHPTFEIGANAFFFTSLSAATIMEGVTSMDQAAFNNTKLEEITLPNSLTNIPTRAFVQNRYLTAVTFGSNVQNIYSEAFYSCVTLSSIVIPDTVEYISDDAFKICTGMTSAVIGSGVAHMGNRVFQGCSNLQSVVMRGPINGGKIPANTFQNCTKLAVCNIPSGTTEIGYNAFEGCHLTAITLPEGVTAVKNGAFLNNSFATAVTLPSTITSIGTETGGQATFGGLTVNTRFTIYATTPPFMKDTSGSNAALGMPGVPIYVPAGSVNAYKNSSYFIIYKDDIQAIQ